jgi:hypothetical protein
VNMLKSVSYILWLVMFGALQVFCLINPGKVDARSISDQIRKDCLLWCKKHKDNGCERCVSRNESGSGYISIRKFGEGSSAWYACKTRKKECVETKLGSSDRDENNMNPHGNGVGDLPCKVTHTHEVTPNVNFSNHFSVYYRPTNLSSPDCSNQYARVPTEYAEKAGIYYQCIWDFYHNASMNGSELAFDSVMGSPHYFHNENLSAIPIWLNKCGSGKANDGSAHPRLQLLTDGGSMPDILDRNAFHEYAHVLFKGYNYFINGGFLPFVNEGIPSYMSIAACDDLSNSNPGCSDCNLKRFLNLSTTPLREYAYCNASSFWYFLALRYTQKKPYSKFVTDRLPTACQIYLADRATSATLLGPLTALNQLPGRDVIKAVENEFAGCHPLGLNRHHANSKGVTHADYTPSCHDLNLYCAGDSRRYPDGCMIDPDKYSYTNDNEYNAKAGEFMMPRVMQLIDEALVNNGFALEEDGLPAKAFRDYLVWNFLQKPDSTDSTQSDSTGYKIRAYGAHYHVTDVQTQSIVAKTLTKMPDLDEWAYAVYYIHPFYGTPVPLIEWGNEHRKDIIIPSSSFYKQAVVIVTALGQTYREGVDSSVSDSGGHYKYTNITSRIKTNVRIKPNPAFRREARPVDLQSSPGIIHNRIIHTD